MEDTKFVDPVEESKTFQFCCRTGRCPELRVEKDKVVLGGVEEGFTYWSIGNLKDFVEASKRGDFDSIVVLTAL